MMKKYLRIIVVIVSVIVIWRLIFHVNLHGEIEDSATWTDTIPKEYSQILNLPDSCCKNGKIIFINTLTSKYRNPVSRFYVNDKYYLQVYKIDSSFRTDLTTAIKEYNTDSSPSYTQYDLDNKTDMEFLYKQTKPQKPHTIYLYLYGDSTDILRKNDTLAYFFCKCINLSIKFGPEMENDFYGKSQYSPNKVPLEIVFQKKLNKLYMFILSSKIASTDLQKGTLLKLLRN